HGDDAESGANLLTQELPRDNIGVVLHGGDDDLVTRLEERPAVALSDEIDAFRGPTHEDELSRVRSIEKPPHRVARALIGVGSLFAQEVDPAMDIRVFRRIILGDRIDHDLWLLARGRIIEVDERLPMDPLLQNGEVLPQAPYVERTLWHFPAFRRNAPRRSRHSVSLRLLPFWNRVDSNSSSRARIGSIGIRLIISLANAYVSRLRAACRPMPRERR